MIIQFAASAKLIIADTIGQEKIVRDLASSLTSGLTIETKPAKLADALRELRQGKVNMVLSNYKLDYKQRNQLMVNCYRYALEPVIFVVNSKNKVSNLSLKQIKDILEGNTLTWAPLGGEAYMIHLAMSKEDQPGMRTLYNKVLKKTDIKAKFFETTNAKGISILASANDKLFGVCGYINLPLAAKSVSVDNVAPTIKNIVSDKYKPTLEYWIWISSKDAHKKTLNHKASVEFIKLLRGEKAVKLIESCGLLANKY
jgi:ABC-type phosphate transport system substrate-binding protein